MSNKKKVHQGEIFRLIIKRSHLKVEDVAEKMNVLPSSLSRSFGYETLHPRKIKLAANILGVDESVFETGIGYDIPDDLPGRIGEDGEEYRVWPQRMSG